MSGGGVALGFALFRRWYPVPPLGEGEAEMTEAERRRFRRWEVGGLVPFFLFLPILTAGWFGLLRGLIDWLRADAGEALANLAPVPVLWLLPSLLLGIITAGFALEWLYRGLLGKDDYRRYVRCCDERAGFEGARTTRWWGGIGVVLLVVTVWVGVSTYTRFDAASVAIGRPWRVWPVVYPYARIERIESRATFRAPNGRIVERPHHVVVFDDGYEWTTRGGLRDPEPSRDAALLRRVAERSGKVPPLEVKDGG